MRKLAATVALGAALGVLTLAGDGSAFCRSTTCRTSGAKECATDANTCPIDGAPLSRNV